MIIWLFSTSLVVFIGYVVVMVVYYKAQYEKELKKNDAIKITLEEAEILLRKFKPPHIVSLTLEVTKGLIYVCPGSKVCNLCSISENLYS